MGLNFEIDIDGLKDLNMFAEDDEVKKYNPNFTWLANMIMNAFQHGQN